MFDFLTNKLSSAFSHLTGQAYLSEKNISQTLIKVREALIQADVPFSAVEKFISDIQQEVVGQKVLKSLKPSEQFIDVVHKKLVSFLGGQSQVALQEFKLPTTIMVMGLQGSGKTTTIAKLANYYKKKLNVKAIVCGSVDFYRPAAIDQLEVLAGQVDINFYRAQSQKALPAAQEIFKYGRSVKADLVLLDTAGRLHIDNTMLQELQELDSLLQPQHKLLILDAMTGQESLRVAQAFEQSIGFEGAILTKVDSDTRSGAAFAFAYELKKPILFVGSGEKIADLELFRPERVACRLLGMGDVQTLMEQADQKIKKHEQMQAEKAFRQGRFTLRDFSKQMDMMNRMGSLGSLIKFIPGMSAQALPQDKILQAEAEMKEFKAIMSSMTPEELLDHTLLQGSRKKRIAKGAGVEVSQINNLLQRFEQMQQFVKLFKKMGKMPGLR